MNLSPLSPPETGIYGPNGLYCFIAAHRECGPACMAYSPAPEGPDYKDQQWATCMLLVNAHRLGKHLVVLASTVDTVRKQLNLAAADSARTRAQSAPPNPAGRP